jgi:hypothetical protein
MAHARKTRGQVAALALLGVGEAGCGPEKTWFNLVQSLLVSNGCYDPVTLDSENIDRFNTMQVVQAERYLASARGYFDLAKRMQVSLFLA